MKKSTITEDSVSTIKTNEANYLGATIERETPIDWSGLDSSRKPRKSRPMRPTLSVPSALAVLPDELYAQESNKNEDLSNLPPTKVWNRDETKKAASPPPIPPQASFRNTKISQNSKIPPDWETMKAGEFNGVPFSEMTTVIIQTPSDQ